MLYISFEFPTTQITNHCDEIYSIVANYLLYSLDLCPDVGTFHLLFIPKKKKIQEKIPIQPTHPTTIQSLTYKFINADRDLEMFHPRIH